MSHIIDQPNKCYGCTACSNICPVGAISMSFDEDGFIQPVVNNSLCIECGKCVDVCPIEHKTFDNFEAPEMYGMFSKEGGIVAGSSSGGAFTHIALETMHRGGYVVGAAFDKDWLAEHIIINEENELEKLRFSKYMQSNQKDCYAQVGSLLKQGLPVMYSGCPCQIAGLKSFLNQLSLDSTLFQNLITVDLLCHGAPSPKFHLEHLQWLCDIDNIDSLEMRARKKAATGYYIRLKNGTSIERNGTRDFYINAFLSHLILRRACHDCAFSRLPRQGDITIGDFWDAKRLKVGQPFEKKSSIVLVNSDKGRRAWQRILEEGPELECIHLNEITDVTALNHNIYRPSVEQEHTLRDTFFRHYKTLSFEKAVAATLFDYDVGLCLHMSNNYGSTATNYALYRTVENLGYHPIVLDNLVPAEGVSKSFLNQKLSHSGTLFERDDWKSVRDVVDRYILGSDQSLNWEFSHNLKYLEFLLFGFTLDYQKRISYSSSFGDYRETTNDPLIASVYRNALARFQHFSVREDYGIKMAKMLFKKEAVQVLDPIFLLKRQEYEMIADESRLEKEQPYLLAYILEPSPEKERLIQSLAIEHGCKTVIIGDAKHRKPLYNDAVSFGNESIEFIDWLACFSQADYIITDSFHGVCFSLMFNKPFIGIKARQSGRFEALANIIETGDPCNSIHFYSNEELNGMQGAIAFSKCNYEKLWKYLESIIQQNLKWLQKSLDEPVVPDDQNFGRDTSLYDSIKLLKQKLLQQRVLSGYMLLSPKAILEIELISRNSSGELFQISEIVPEKKVRTAEKNTKKGFKYVASLDLATSGKQRVVLQCTESGKVKIRLKGSEPAIAGNHSFRSKVRYDLLKINEIIVFDQEKYASFDDPIVVTKTVSKGSNIVIDIKWMTDCLNKDVDKMKYNIDPTEKKPLVKRIKRKVRRLITNT